MEAYGKSKQAGHGLMIDVVAALIWDADRFLICQRPEHKARPLLWEFPGGKVEPGETREEALVRECREELSVELSVRHLFADTVYRYADACIHLWVYNAVIADGVPQLLEHHDLKWIKIENIRQHDFCPADEAVLFMLGQQAERRWNGMTYLRFDSRAVFRKWLSDNHTASDGVWVLFGKSGGPQTITANEALEEALCFGWIDGQMKSVDDQTYVKYFSRRRKGSKWSDKNKKLSETLEKQGLMTDAGRATIEDAKQYGQWDAPKAPAMTQEHVEALLQIIKGHEPAHTNIMAMPPSVKKTYARAYFDAKTDEGRQRRLARIIERLDQNLKPM